MDYTDRQYFYQLRFNLEHAPFNEETRKQLLALLDEWAGKAWGKERRRFKQLGQDARLRG